MGNGWEEYQKLVIDKLENHAQQLKDIHADLVKIHEDIASLKVKSGVWGLVGGLIPSVIVIAAWLVKML